jgi:hypothetical protein
VSDGAKLPGLRCPRCGKLCDDYTSIAGPDVKPKPGNIIICAYCAAVLRFTADMRFEPVLGSALRELLKDREFAQEFVRAAFAARAMGNYFRMNSRS